MIESTGDKDGTVLVVKSKPAIFSTPHFVYYAGYLPDCYDALLSILRDKFAKNFSRLSCQVNFTKEEKIYYGDVLLIECPEEINRLKNWLETNLKIKFDFCLIHHYTDGKSTIGYHSDKEAECSYVVSLSFGETRKFRFRKRPPPDSPPITKGYDYELNLESGDIVVMLPGCQTHYVHTVPVEKKKKGGRINLTFRQK